MPHETNTSGRTEPVEISNPTHHTVSGNFSQFNRMYFVYHSSIRDSCPKKSCIQHLQRTPSTRLSKRIALPTAPIFDVMGTQPGETIVFHLILGFLPLEPKTVTLNSSKLSYTKRPFDASLMLGSRERGMIGIIARSRTHYCFLFLFGLLESYSVPAFLSRRRDPYFLRD